jgi:23S rRNA (uridine2552-2'-O)-methyltransferase
MSRRTKSSKQWLAAHEADDFVRRARAEGWRSRAVFKLQELDQRGRLIKPGMCVVDLGAAPGAWSQYVGRRLHGRGRIVALDVLEMEPLAGVDVLQGDFREPATLHALERLLGSDRVDLVLCDMAPNISGQAAVDQPRAMYLAELALDFARERLEAGGSFVCKVFQGEGFQEFVQETRSCFESVRTRKPKASRARSREVYLVARNYLV